MKRSIAVVFGLLALLSTMASSRPRPGPKLFHGRISVRLVSFPLRVLDRHTRPVFGIRASDIQVTIDDRPAKVVAVESQTSRHPESRQKSILGVRLAQFDSRRLIVFFFQASFQDARLSGQVRTLPRAKRMLSSFAPGDWVAVASFDSHLKLRQDFTHDHQLIEKAMDRALFASPPKAGSSESSPSLRRHLDLRAARRAASPARALELVGDALTPLVGEKTIILVGWGLGRFGSDGAEMTPGYAPAREALLRAGAVVFVLDVTSADYHSLEFGLRRVAADTGGAYRKTNDFPDIAAADVASAIENDYRVTVLAPPLAPGDYELTVRIRHRRGRPSPSSRRILLR